MPRGTPWGVIVSVQKKTAVPASINQPKLATLVATAVNEWLWDEHLDELHEICYEVVKSELPDVEEDELWEVLPDIFDRLRPFTAG